MPRNTKAISENIQKQVLKGVTEKYKPNYPSTVLPGYFTGYPRNPKNMPRSVRNVGRFTTPLALKRKDLDQKCHSLVYIRTHQLLHRLGPRPIWHLSLTISLITKRSALFLNRPNIMFREMWTCLVLSPLLGNLRNTKPIINRYEARRPGDLEEVTTKDIIKRFPRQECTILSRQTISKPSSKDK